MDINSPNVLKRCLSVPIINNVSAKTAPTTTTAINNSTFSTAMQTDYVISPNNNIPSTSTLLSDAVPHLRSNSSSRDESPSQIMNIFAPRARRYSASFASLGANGAAGPRVLTPRVSQLRQEECVDMNSREVNHEREVHCAMQISQSWEDLTLVAESWSCKSEDLSNPLHVLLPTGPTTRCSSPSPTSRTGIRLPYGLSPSPTRRTFATRRSMSPIAMRPSQLGSVKRKFELEDSAWNTYSSPPLKKMFTESNRGPSPVCQSPSSDSGTYEGRTTPKLFVSKLYTNSTNSSSSVCSSPLFSSPIIEVPQYLQQNSSSSSPVVASSLSNEPMSVTSGDVDTENEIADTNTLNRKVLLNSAIDKGTFLNAIGESINKTKSPENNVTDICTTRFEFCKEDFSDGNRQVRCLRSVQKNDDVKNLTVHNNTQQKPLKKVERISVRDEGINLYITEKECVESIINI